VGLCKEQLQSALEAAVEEVRHETLLVLKPVATSSKRARICPGQYRSQPHRAPTRRDAIRNNVLDVKGMEAVMLLGQAAILTSVAGALADEAPKLRVYQEAACCFR